MNIIAICHLAEMQTDDTNLFLVSLKCIGENNLVTFSIYFILTLLSAVKLRSTCRVYSSLNLTNHIPGMCYVLPIIKIQILLPQGTQASTMKCISQPAKQSTLFLGILDFIFNCLEHPILLLISVAPYD